VPATGAITFWVPLTGFAFRYGLSMDYEVFILFRMVCSLLVPATVSLFGRWNWWLPAWAARLLRIPPTAPGDRGGGDGADRAHDPTGAVDARSAPGHMITYSRT
jgi:uncharacterized membrane protein YdfJ with MMPL/SSD domain